MLQRPTLHRLPFLNARDVNAYEEFLESIISSYEIIIKARSFLFFKVLFICETDVCFESQA